MRVHLVNPSQLSFGVGLITPRWLYVLAGATPAEYGEPHIVDETLQHLNLDDVTPGDVVGISVHTGNVRRGYELGRSLQAHGAHVVYGGVHASLYPDEPFVHGGASTVVRGDGDQIWPEVLADFAAGSPQKRYEGGKVEADQFHPARWDLVPHDRYMWATVQTVRGCPKHCSFCSVWRTDGQKPRQPANDIVLQELVELRRIGFRFVVLADDNFYPVTLEDIETAKRTGNVARLAQLEADRKERFELLERMGKLGGDMRFFTQITMEAAEDHQFLSAMKKAGIVGVLVGVESVTPEGLKAVFKDFNAVGETLVNKLREFRRHDIHVLGSFIFGLPSDTEATFQATADLANEADVSFSQFLRLTPFPGTVDFERWEKDLGEAVPRVNGVPITRYWLIPNALRPKLYFDHPNLSGDDIRRLQQTAWDQYYSFGQVWPRSRRLGKLRHRVAFTVMSKMFRQMYGNTGISTDSARVDRAARWAGLLAKPCVNLFHGAPMPEMQLPS